MDVHLIRKSSLEEVFFTSTWVFPKIGGVFTPKMDGEHFMENPMNKWDDLGGRPIFLETSTCALYIPWHHLGFLEPKMEPGR